MIFQAFIQAGPRGPALFLLALAAGLVGCAHPAAPGATQDAVAPTRLASALAELAPDVSPEEAGRLAEMAVSTSAELAIEYGAHRPAWLNNMLVNVGVRERGLCYHWASDLFARLQPDHYQTLELHLAVARLKTSREHNAVVVTARGQSFKDGIVLDPWRECGRLYWGKVAQDRYPWGLRPPDPP